MQIEDYPREVTLRLGQVNTQATLLRETEGKGKNKGAYQVDFGDREVWLPKSQCEWEDTETLVVAEWLAEKIIYGEE